MIICKEEMCVGCTACSNICPTNAIEMEEDKEGFLRPIISEGKCVECEKCKKACPVNELTVRKSYSIKTYACWHEDEEIRKNSTSGGIFTALSMAILLEKGVVFGVQFDDDFRVVHGLIERPEELYKFRGSKYVQSNMGDIYKQVKSILIQDRLVLFTGTPCQVAGLYGYLGKDYDNLFTCDLICHGVPSPRVFKDYLDYMSKKFKNEIKDIRFRYKKPSWNIFSMYIRFNNNKRYLKDTHHDPYIVGFLRNQFLRPSCYKCQFTNTDRQGDLTIADFWGYRDSHDDKGISLVLANSDKGQKILNKCKGINIFERTLDEAVQGNPCLSKSFEAPKNREKFWEDYDNIEFKDIVKKYFYPNKLPMKVKLYNLLTYEQRRKIKKLLGR